MPAYVGSGSKASDRRVRRVRGMSAVPPIAPELLRCSNSTKSASSGHMHCSKFGEDSAPSSAGTSSVVDKVKIGRTLRVTNPINASG